MDQLGTYEVIYSVVDQSGNYGDEVTRYVVVADRTQPVVSIIGEASEKVEVFDRYVDLRVTYSDNYWSSNSLTLTIDGSFYEAFPDGKTDSLGRFEINYHVTDGSGNTTTVTRELEVVDTEAPTINFENILKICQWDDQADLLEGVSAKDNYDNSSQITISVVEDDINIHEEGFYSVKYVAEDASGNKSDAELRMAIVENCNVSITDQELESALSIFPNPSNGNVNIALDLPNRKDVVISITNMHGQVVEVIDAGQIEKVTYQRNFANHGAGVYLIRVQTESNSIVKKVEVIR